MPMINVTERQKLLIEYIQKLQESKKNVLKLFLRGTEPWEVELLIKDKTALRPAA